MLSLPTEPTLQAKSICVAHGRFQPLHIGHMEYLVAAKQCGDYLVVGITDPDPSQSQKEEKDPSHGTDEANPCTYYERYQIIQTSLVEAGVPSQDFCIVPFPISFPERIPFYVPTDALFAITIYDEWGETKLQRLQDLGFQTTVLWYREHKVTTGTQIREAIRKGAAWEHWVTPATARLLMELGIIARMQHETGQSLPSSGIRHS